MASGVMHVSGRNIRTTDFSLFFSLSLFISISLPLPQSFIHTNTHMYNVCKTAFSTFTVLLFLLVHSFGWLLMPMLLLLNIYTLYYNIIDLLYYIRRQMSMITSTTTTTSTTLSLSLFFYCNKNLLRPCFNSEYTIILNECILVVAHYNNNYYLQYQQQWQQQKKRVVKWSCLNNCFLSPFFFLVFYSLSLSSQTLKSS